MKNWMGLLMNEVNELFTKENVEQIVVPQVVKDDLLSIIEEKLKRAGFYYRIAYRVKAVDSMVNKLIFKDYRRPGTENEDKKMQDLVGIRIILYFVDDVDICRKLLDTLFISPGMWETTENNEYEFKAMKVNGIFKLPAYLSKTIVNPYLSDYVDDTFEVQVRTNSFEGWHEIEHDMRYKGSAFGIGNEALARKMNSILATFELCDDSIAGLLEDLGHQHYKDKKWNDMLRCHYRLKFENEPLHPYIEELFDSDTELAKIFYKAPRQGAIEQLWLDTSENGIELTLNNIVKIVNQIGPDDERLNEAFRKIEQEHKNKQEFEAGGKRRRFEPFKPLGNYKVFQSHSCIDLTNLSMEDAFKKAVNYIYSWVHSRFNEVFDDMPGSVDTYDNERPGYKVSLEYDNENLYFKEITTHLDSKVANRLWISVATIKKDGDRLLFDVSNEYAEPADKYRDNENVLFSRPNFYGEIADNIGICDVERLRQNVRGIDNEEEYNTLKDLIKDDNRQFPVVVFVASDDYWIEKFDVDYFAYLVGYYAHIKRITTDELSEQFAKDYDLDEDEFRDSITVFYPGRGLRVKTRRGRGKLSVLDDISFENIDMDNVMTPFVVNSFYFCDPDGKTEYVGSKKPLPVDDRTPSIKKFTFKNINAKNCHVAGTYICGLPESKIEELTFENINITYADNAKSGVAAMMLGCDEASRQGMIVSNINTLILDNVKVTGCDGEEIVAENVDNIIKK